LPPAPEKYRSDRDDINPSRFISDMRENELQLTEVWRCEIRIKNKESIDLRECTGAVSLSAFAVLRLICSIQEQRLRAFGTNAHSGYLGASGRRPLPKQAAAIPPGNAMSCPR
jgi:hypothetical protein